MGYFSEYFMQIWRWLTTAAADEMKLAHAVAQNTSTNAAIFLLIVGASIVLVVSAISISRRRGRDSTRRDVTASFSSAISSFSALRLARPHLDATSSYEHTGTDSRSARTGTRTETKIVDVRPYLEQSTIDLMAKFKWQLQSSQRVRWQDSHLEQRGEKIYSVTESEDYVHLVFVRDLDEPNIGRIKTLEWEYFSIVFPYVPGYIGPILLSIFMWPLIPLWIVWAVNIAKRRRIANEEIPKLRARQAEILAECDEL